MKKTILITTIALFMAAALPAQELSIDEAVVRAARSIEEELPQRAMVLVLNIASPSEAFSEYMIEEITGELIQGRKISVVDRRNLASLRDELKFQYSGEVSDETIQMEGRMHGASAVLSGSLTDMRSNYRFRIRIINVETAHIQSQLSFNLKKDEHIAYLMGGERAVQEVEKRQQETEREQQRAQAEQQRAEAEQQRIESKKPTANVRKNWFSGGLSSGVLINQSFDRRSSGLDIDAGYERMLSPKISIGANFLWQILDMEPDTAYYVIEEYTKYGYKKEDMEKGNGFSIELSLRFYPWGKKFFLGLVAGYYHSMGKEIDTSGHRAIINATGPGGGLQFGWKVDAGEEGGFYWQTGFVFTLLAGEKVWGWGRDIESHPAPGAFIRFFFSVGWAF